MKIKKLEIHRFQTPLRSLFQTSHAVRTFQKSVFLRITDSEGYSGIGVIDPAPGYMEETAEEVFNNLEKIGPLLVEMTPHDYSSIMGKTAQLVPDKYNTRALIEMALLDLNCRVSGKSISVFLGGSQLKIIPVLGWIGLREPEDAANEALNWVKKGFQALKIKVGSGIDKDVERVHAVRSAVGKEIEIRVDANEAYTPEISIKLINQLASLGISLCEQPVPRGNWEALAELRKKVSVPLMADEGVYDLADLKQIIKKSAADIVKLKVMKQGGILNTLKMMEMAAEAGISCIIGHGFNHNLTNLAEMHLAALNYSNVLLPGEMVGPLKMADDITNETLTETSGAFILPDAAGLGMTVNEEKLMLYSQQTKIITKG